MQDQKESNSRLIEDPESLSTNDSVLPKPKGIHLISSGKSAGNYLITVGAGSNKVIPIGHTSSIDKAAEVHDLVSIGLYGGKAALNFPAAKYKMESFIEIVLSLQKLFPSSKFWVAFKNALEAGLVLHPGSSEAPAKNSNQNPWNNLQVSKSFCKSWESMLEKLDDKTQEQLTATNNIMHHGNSPEKEEPLKDPSKEHDEKINMDMEKITSKSQSELVGCWKQPCASQRVANSCDTAIDVPKETQSADQWLAISTRQPMSKNAEDTKEAATELHTKIEPHYDRIKIPLGHQNDSAQYDAEVLPQTSAEEVEHEQQSFDSKESISEIPVNLEAETNVEKQINVSSPPEATLSRPILEAKEVLQNRLVPPFQYKGVDSLNGGLSYASIFWEGQQLCIGQYTSPEDAARAFDLISLGLFGPEADINYLPTNYTSSQVQEAIIYLKNSTGHLHRKTVEQSIRKAEAAGVPPSPIYIGMEHQQAHLNFEADETVNNKTRTGRPIKRPIRYRDSPIYISDTEDSPAPTRDSECARARKASKRFHNSSSKLLALSSQSGVAYANTNLPMMMPAMLPPVFPVSMMGGMAVPLGFSPMGSPGCPPLFHVPHLLNSAFAHPLQHQNMQ